VLHLLKTDSREFVISSTVSVEEPCGDIISPRRYRGFEQLWPEKEHMIHHIHASSRRKERVIQAGRRRKRLTIMKS
jgi:hypothetical protein